MHNLHKIGQTFYVLHLRTNYLFVLGGYERVFVSNFVPFYENLDLDGIIQRTTAQQQSEHAANQFSKGIYRPSDVSRRMTVLRH